MLAHNIISMLAPQPQLVPLVLSREVAEALQTFAAFLGEAAAVFEGVERGSIRRFRGREAAHGVRSRGEYVEDRDENADPVRRDGRVFPLKRCRKFTLVRSGHVLPFAVSFAGKLVALAG